MARLGTFTEEQGLSERASNASYRLRDDVVATVLDYGALLLDLDSKYFYLLNPSGWAIARLFEDGATVEHALTRARNWGAPDADVDGVHAFIDKMLGEGLLEAAHAPANVDGEPPATWEPVRIERQAEPLQKVIVSAFDPSIPLAE